MGTEFVEAFRAAMRAAGLNYAGSLQADGRLHRFKPAEAHSESGWYVLHADGPVPAGAFGDWRLALSEKWHHQNGKEISGAELAALKKQWAAIESQRRKDEEERQERFAAKAAEYCARLTDPPPDHLYLQTKSVGILGKLKINSEGELVLPLEDAEGRIWSYQTIDILGDKLFMPGGRVSGCYFVVNDRSEGPLVICEGYATGATIHEATGWAVVCAMNCGNLLAVAGALRQKHPNRLLVMAADNDRFNPENPGLNKARAAAKSTKAHLVFPTFADADAKGTDFNDLALAHDLGSVAAAFGELTPLPFVRGDKLIRYKLPPLRQYLGDMVLCAGSVAGMLAQGGVGKSMLALQTSAACAAGRDRFLAWDIHPAAHQLTWVFVQFENTAHRIQSDFELIRRWLTQDEFERFLRRVHVLFPTGQQDEFGLNLDNLNDFSRLASSLQLIGPDVVVFDALYNTTERELKNGADMKIAMSACIRVCRKCGLDVLPFVLHHSLAGLAGAQKSIGYDRASFARDSKIFQQVCRSIINIAPCADSEEHNDRLLVSCGKMNDAKEFSPFVIRRMTESRLFELDTQADVAAEIADLKSANRRTSGVSPEKVRELCEVTGSTKADLARAIMNRFSIRRSAAFKHIKIAMECEQLEFKEPSGLCFRK